VTLNHLSCHGDGSSLLVARGMCLECVPAIQSVDATLWPSLKASDIRGNVGSRLEKGGVDRLVPAAATMLRQHPSDPQLVT